METETWGKIDWIHGTGTQGSEQCFRTCYACHLVGLAEWIKAILLELATGGTN